MKIMLALVFLTLAVARPCRADWKRNATTALFVAAQTTLVMDALQTLDIKNSRCLSGPRCTWRHEDGWAQAVIGRTPSDGAILAYFGTGMAINTAIYLWGPNWLSASVSTFTLAVEIPTIAGNFKVGARFSF